MALIYKYSTILRILDFNDKNSVMIDIDSSTCEILSVFDSQSKFDADFILSFKNLVEQRATGFTKINSGYSNIIQNLLDSNSIKEYPKIKKLLDALIKEFSAFKLNLDS